jgi:hypothetical protein
MSTESQRKAWAAALCKDGQMRSITLYGGLKIQVHTGHVGSVRRAIRGPRQTRLPGGPERPWRAWRLQLPTNNGRLETFPHSYGIAADINPSRNPYGKELITDMPRAMVEEIEALRTNSGKQVFRWGGDWDGDGH